MGYLHKSPTWQQMQVNDSHQSNVMVIDEYVTLTPMQWLNQLSRHFVRKPSYITNPLFNSNQVFFLSICQLEILVVPIRHAHFQLVSDSLSNLPSVGQPNSIFALGSIRIRLFFLFIMGEKGSVGLGFSVFYLPIEFVLK